MRHLLPGYLDRLVFPDELFRPDVVNEPPADDGVVANARLTALLGAALVVAFSAVGVTLLDTRGLIDWHAGLGIAAAVIVVAKLASTGYRFARYYSRNGRYVASGPPQPVMRALAPLLVLATAAVIGTGVVALYQPDTIWKGLHKLSFFGWIALAAAHVLVYFWRLPRVIAAPRGRSPRLAAAPAVSLGIFVVTLVAGAVVAVWFVGQMPMLPPEMHHGHHG